MTRTGNNLCHQRNMRSGVAVVEAAICLPLIVLLMLGTLEICSGYYLKESLTIAAYEGARAAVKRRATAEDAEAQVLAFLESRDVSLNDSGKIEIIPPDFSDLDALDPITIRVTANTTGNSVLIFDAMLNRDITAEVVMVREFTEPPATIISE